MTFLVGAHRFGVPFPKLQTFSEIFWALHIDYSQCEMEIKMKLKMEHFFQMELKMYTLAGLKFVFEKIKFKALHYIQHDFIRQRPGLSKDQINMFKSLVINYFILKYRHTF